MGNFAGNQYTVGLGIRDHSGTNGEIGGTATVVEEHTEMELTTVNPINFNGAFTQAQYERSGRRGLVNQDYYSTYGTGVWTWDFDWLANDELIAQKLLSLIYPTGAGNQAGTALTIPAAPINVDMSHLNTGDIDSTADITILAPTYTDAAGIADEDMSMRSAVLQNLTIACDMATDGGRPHMSGQFMTGYKPTISNSGTSLTARTAGNEWDYSLFDLTTRTLFGSATQTIKSFSLTIDNPATRVGWQGTAMETDGYMRSGYINVSGSVTAKLNSAMADHLDTWITSGAIGSPTDKATTAITLENGSDWSIALPAVLITGFTQDTANDGIFVTVDFVATAGAAGAFTNLAVIKMT